MLELAAIELAVLGQPARDADRRVAGEGADLDRAPGADRAREQRHERALVGGDLHHRHVALVALGLGREAASSVVLARAALDHVAVELVGRAA